MNRTVAFLSGVAVLAALHGAERAHREKPRDGYTKWNVVAGGKDAIHYSRLDQINGGNVRQLQVAWTYDAGDSYPGSEMQCNPIVVGGTLYATSPRVRAFALDAATGKLKWSFDPYPGEKISGKMRNRGVNYWADGNDRRIFFAARQYLYALDADTGHAIPTFGNDGRIDLREGLGRAAETLSVSSTSPGVVYNDLLIMGSIVPEALPSAPGDIRAYDVRTGKVRWQFHTLPHPGEPGYETWARDSWDIVGGVNNWAGMSLDETRGLLFVPTGSAAFDFYGANRIGDNLFANCLIAIRADTGERVWYFQGVKHDVWDRDFPSTPALVTVLRDGRLVDAVAQTTKSGYVYVFERDTGKPLFPIEYRKVAASDVPGERLAETQPFPLMPEPFARQQLTEDLLTNRTPDAHKSAVEALRKLRSGPQFTPPSTQGTIIFPGFDGGAEWGGPAFDPETGLIYINSNEMAWVLRLVKMADPTEVNSGRQLYESRCAGCHRVDRKGTPPEFPALTALSSKFDEAGVERVIAEGRGRMPAYRSLSRDAIRALARYLLAGEDERVAAARPSKFDVPYTIDGYNKFLDPQGYPAVAPPWGTLNAISLDTGKYAWKIPFGEYPELAKQGMKDTGSENYGGAVVTAGGLLFIAATLRDNKIHAFDKATGELLWEATLPAGGSATPAVYMAGGREYVVIAAGGGKLDTPSAGVYVAFALPSKRGQVQPSN